MLPIRAVKLKPMHRKLNPTSRWPHAHKLYYERTSYSLDSTMPYVAVDGFVHPKRIDDREVDTGSLSVNPKQRTNGKSFSIVVNSYCLRFTFFSRKRNVYYSKEHSTAEEQLISK